MPSFSSLEYIFSRRQKPTTNYPYLLLWGYGMNFDSLDMIHSERRRRRPQYHINLKRVPDQSFSISSVTDLQPEGRLER